MNDVSIEPRISIAKARSVASASVGRRQVELGLRIHAGYLAADGQPARRVVVGHGQRRLDPLAHQLARDGAVVPTPISPPRSAAVTMPVCHSARLSRSAR